MIKKTKTIIKQIIATRNLKKSLIKVKSKKIIYIGSPLHGNIGDHAISIAIMDILGNCGFPIVEIPGERYMLTRKKVIDYVSSDDVIILTGGGLIGNLWLNEEKMIKSVFSDFKENKIIIMPHTFYFDESLEGKEELKQLENLINKHGNVYIIAREENTFNFCKKHFSSTAEVVCLPDVVLTINYSKDNKRNGVLFVLRNDKEKAAGLGELVKFFDGKDVTTTTTVLNKRVSVDKRKQVLETKLAEFQNAKLVITDRLHGMIFAAITGTPCIAFDNKSKKVSGVYKWLDKLPYIKFCDKLDKFEFYLSQIDLSSHYEYTLAEQYKKKIIDYIQNIL